jgi:gliding motility-associated-like protein
MESYGVQGLPNSVYFWDVDGGTIVDTLYGLNNDSVVVRWDYERRDHSITVTEFTEFGCYGIPMGGNINVSAPVVGIGDDLAVCEDTTITIEPTVDYHLDVTYLWSDGSTGNTYTDNEEGYVWVKVTGTDQCYDYDSVYLTVNPLPIVFLGNDTVLCGTQTMILDPGFYSSYEWSTGDISHQIEIDGRRTEPELFWVNVVDENGCRGRDTMMLEVCDASILFLNMPNTITPGDESHNNTWHIPNIELFPDANLEIFDRWGRLVFKTNDIANNEWNGESMSGVELPMDAYYFVLDLRVSHVKPITGYVNVIR